MNIVSVKNTVVFYLGAEPLHIGLYTHVINLMDKAGFEVVLVVRQLLDVRHPLRALIERKHVIKQYVRPGRRLMRGNLYGPIFFHYRAKILYLFPLLYILLGSYLRGKRIILHARTLHVADAALQIRRLLPKIRVIAELEGDGESELRYSLIKEKSYSNKDLTKRLQIHTSATERVLTMSDAVLCASKRLMEVLVERHKLSMKAQQKIFVFPTLVSGAMFNFDESKRDEIRQLWGLENQFVIVYSGNLVTPWQLPEETVRLFCQIRLIRADAHLFVLSPEPDHRFILPHLERAGIMTDDYQLRSATYEEVPGYLCAADVGIILREKHLMNEVASPGKMGEYLLSGLPVIMTESVGEYAAQLLGLDQVLILSDLRDWASVEQEVSTFCAQEFTDNQRLTFSNWAANRFSIESWAPVLEEVYRNLS